MGLTDPEGNPYSPSMQITLSEQGPSGTLSQITTFGNPGHISLAEILERFDRDTRPDGHGSENRSGHQPSSPGYGAQSDSTNLDVSEPNTLVNPLEIYEFMADWGHVAIEDTPRLPGIGPSGTPLTRTTEPYTLYRFLAIRTSDEPLIHEARPAIRARRVLEGQDMLRTRQEEGWQGQRADTGGLTRDRSVDFSGSGQVVFIINTAF